MFAPKSILVPTDFSEHSDEALKEAVELARQYHSRVYLLHVSEPITQCAGDYCLDAAMLKNAEKDARKLAQERMAKEIAKFSEDQDVEIISDIRKTPDIHNNSTSSICLSVATCLTSLCVSIHAYDISG